MARARGVMSKLLATGVAYAHHVRFLDLAYRLPQSEVAEAVSNYVGNLSGAGRTGFRLTALTLAQRERSDPQRRAFLQLVAGVTGEDAAAVPPVSVLPNLGPRDYADDLALVAAWFPLSAVEQRNAVREHLTTLSADDRESFCEHVRRMPANVAHQIADHDADEDKAWGPYIEDQMSYRMAKLRTGQADPKWLEQRAELERYLAFFEHVVASID